MTARMIAGRAESFAFRWHDCATPGRYVVHIAANPATPAEWTELHDVPGYAHETSFDFGANFQAVVDDFGRLVRVAS